MTKTEKRLFPCRDCGQDKPREEMCASKRIRVGVTKQCKACRSKQRCLNGEYMMERLRKYEMRKAGGGPVRITFDDLREFMSKKTCTYCGVKLTLENNDPAEQCIDHVYPISDVFDGYGGENIAQNGVTCCRTCNSAKGNSHVYEFYSRWDKFTPILWTKFVGEFGRRMVGRELTALEVEYIKRGFEEEAAELRAYLDAEKVASDS